MTETESLKLSGKIKRSRTMVVYELPEKQNDYGLEYRKEFIAFLESLGFEVEIESHFDMLGEIKINGTQFKCHFGKVSYLAKNGWTREWKPRANRSVALEVDVSRELVVIHINKEIDKERLINRVKSKIDESKKIYAERKLSNEVRLATASMLFDKYKNVDGFIGCSIRDGRLHVRTTELTMVVNSDGVVEKYEDITMPGIETPAELSSVVNRVASLVEMVKKATEQVKLLGATGVTKETPAMTAYLVDGEMRVLQS